MWNVFLSSFLGLCFSLLTHRYPSRYDYAACVPATEEPNHRGKDRPAPFRCGLLLFERSGYLDTVSLGIPLDWVLLFVERCVQNLDHDYHLEVITEDDSHALTELSTFCP